MELTHVMEYRFQRTADGAIWTDTSYEYGYWRRYLNVFDSVAVVARVGDGQVQSGWLRVDGPGVRVVSVPHYVGPAEYALCAHQVHAGVQAAMNTRSAVLLRVPSQLAIPAASALWRQKRPYAVHVVGDPSEAFARGVNRHPLRRAFRWWFTRHQSRQCSKAVSAWYVTPRLRFAYPPDEAERVLDCPDVHLENTDFRFAPRKYAQTGCRRLVTVATLSQIYKGVDVLLSALAICRSAGLPLELTVVGSGKYASSLIALARRLGLGDSVRFLGALPAGGAVRRELDVADMFVLPSLTEGMPRALLEAMARALPCVATRVGGIPDVLDDKYLVSPGDDAALADKIRHVVASPGMLNSMSEENLETAKQFGLDELSPQWDRFLVDLLERTRSYFRHSPVGMRA